MSCSGTETNPGLTRPELWCIVGYGNPQRRDDGLGPHVVAELGQALKGKERLHFLVRHQLEPELAEDLAEAGQVILVDATVNRLRGGWRRTRVRPRLGDSPQLTHSFRPEFLVGLMGLFKKRPPTTWLVSIQGDDFGFGEGLSPGAQERARQVIADLAEFVSKED